MEVAHGLGGGSDLPIPASFAIGAGTAALALSFVVLLLAWREPRLAGDGPSRPVPAGVARVWSSRWTARLLRAAGLVLFGYTAVAAVLGPDLLSNPTFGILYVWLWVGIVPMSLLLGPFYRSISPVRTLHALLVRSTGGDLDDGPVSLPGRWGCWPAAVGLFAFVWLEVVYPSSTYLGPVRLWFAAYLAVMIVGAALFGRRWFAVADPFEVYSTLVGKLSVLGRDADGRLVRRSPLRHLATVRAEPGLVAVVAVLLGSTAFDSFGSSSFWLQRSQDLPVDATLVNTALLLTVCLVVGATFSVAVMSAGAIGATSRRALPAAFAHSLVPIVVGYMVAHYLSFLVEVGQTTLINASDPLGTGADLLGTADWQVNYVLSLHPTLLASIKVVAIVTGHVLGVVAAHDKALEVLPARHRVSGQLPLLVVMTLYTFAGLYLLFGV